jgi:5'-deoxynucleotidase YfbR-like HD superfamily hydrolase
MADKTTDPARAWQRMLSGRRLDLLDPSPLDIEISDIAHGLPRVARWNGQTSATMPFPSHSTPCWSSRSFALPIRPALNAAKLAALLHDAPEYVIGDMISPFKAVVGGGYKLVESRLQEAIHRRFGLAPILPSKVREAIKKADQVAAYLEATALAGFSADEATRVFGTPRGLGAVYDLRPLPAAQVQDLFLARFVQLAST